MSLMNCESYTNLQPIRISTLNAVRSYAGLGKDRIVYLFKIHKESENKQMELILITLK